LPACRYTEDFGWFKCSEPSIASSHSGLQVFSADMFATKFKNDVMSIHAGREYRAKILRPGGSVDAADMLRNFLGRDPNEAAFLESKGV
jgi:Zn-dependent oligopeptidase